MHIYTINLIQSLALIVLGIWGYAGSETPSVTALIPAFFGVILLALYGGIKKQKKAILLIAGILSLLIIFALFMPLNGAYARGDMAALMRVTAMMALSALSFGALLKVYRLKR